MPQLDYGTHGIHGLSYSRRGQLHQCPRLFQLEQVFGLAKRTDSVTFSYGHAVAAGIQEYFESGNRNLAIAKCGMYYSMPWDDIGTVKEAKQKKNLPYAIQAVDNFIRIMDSKLPADIDELRDWKVAMVTLPTGQVLPAVELQFRILCHDDFVYEGHIDLVLEHKQTGEYAVLEIKTTSLRDPHNAMYGNSDQALSYSIVIDTLLESHGQTSYKVFYLIYSSSAQGFILKSFPKEVKRRFNWINDLIRDIELLQYYEASAQDGIPYPMNGASCYHMFSPCRYFGSCTMEDDSLVLLYKNSTTEAAFSKEDNVHFTFTLDEIIQRQTILATDRAGYEGIGHLIDEI